MPEKYARNLGFVLWTIVVYVCTLFIIPVEFAVFIPLFMIGIRIMNKIDRLILLREGKSENEEIDEGDLEE